MDSPLDSQPESLKLNISAYRVLYILWLLVCHRSLSAVELNRHLQANRLIQRGFNNDTIAKYINTLRETGCRIQRRYHHRESGYHLLQSPFPLTFEADELNAARRLLPLMATQADEALHVRYHDLLQKLAWALEDPEAAQQLFEGPPVLDPAVQEEDRLVLIATHRETHETLKLNLDSVVTSLKR